MHINFGNPINWRNILYLFIFLKTCGLFSGKTTISCFFFTQVMMCQDATIFDLILYISSRKTLREDRVEPVAKKYWEIFGTFNERLHEYGFYIPFWTENEVIRLFIHTCFSSKGPFSGHIVTVILGAFRLLWSYFSAKCVPVWSRGYSSVPYILVTT